MVLKPIPTSFEGVYFRSRLEARWACFFSRLGIPWRYEAQGFDLGPAGWYLPDFELDGCGVGRFFAEVKAIDEPSTDEIAKIVSLAYQGRCVVLGLFGRPSGSVRVWDGELGFDNLDAELMDCRRCSGVSIQSNVATYGGLACDCGERWRFPADNTRVLGAAVAANRFDFAANRG